jgi:hypothetical protein
MLKPTQLVAGIALAVLITGCEPCHHYNRLQVVAYSGPVKAPAPERKPYGAIKPYDTAQDVGRPFEVIGFMSMEGPAADEATVLKAMLYRACDMGADGIILNPATMGNQPQLETKVDVRVGWAAIIGNGSDRAYRAQAIRFKGNS